MDYKIIVLDLDGTLTNRDKVITPRTKEALMKAQEAGKIVVLASGRPTAGVEPLAKELDLARFGSYILSYNGGMITNCKTGEVIFSSLRPVESIHYLPVTLTPDVLRAAFEKVEYFSR